MDTPLPAKLWRSLSPQNELPQPVHFGGAEIDRRDFLKLAASAIAASGLASCAAQPPEYIVPYVNRPESSPDTDVLRFTTAMPMCGSVFGLVAESHGGHPVKLEGNPRHPASLGATHVQAQASILDLYDPSRERSIFFNGSSASWEPVSLQLRSIAEKKLPFLLVTPPDTSPSFESLARRALAAVPGSKWCFFTPYRKKWQDEASQRAFGSVLSPNYNFRNVQTVLLIGGDPFAASNEGVRYARDYSDSRRDLDRAGGAMRTFSIESTPSAAGLSADLRIALTPAEMERFVWAIAAKLGAIGSAAANRASADERLVETIANDLRSSGQHAVSWASPGSSALVQELSYRINDALGATNTSLGFVKPILPPDIEELALDEIQSLIESERKQAIIIIDADMIGPPKQLEALTKSIRALPVSIASHRYRAAGDPCKAFVPSRHYLESWGDGLAYDGTASIIQPLILPLFGGMSRYELLGAVLSDARKDYEHVRDYWKGIKGSDRFDDRWRDWLQAGMIEGSPSAILRPKLQPFVPSGQRDSEPARELVLLTPPDSNLLGGEFSRNDWLNELPRPVTKLSWGNALLIAPQLAKEIGVADGDQVQIRRGAGSAVVPVMVSPGHAPRAVTLQTGDGAMSWDRAADQSPFALRTKEHDWIAGDVTITRTGKRAELISTQHHHEIAAEGILPILLPGGRLKPVGPVMSAQTDRGAHAWGMNIDVNSCIGCNACTIACQAENNIPTVGKDEVGRGREMYWIRVDGYYTGSPENPRIFHQPVPCMHCEKAPCELVCPVGATVHSSEGLNEQVYNRCVGTRFCSNNCPYKVRRFNFFRYADTEHESLKLMRNPDVTVRSRGIMEKCTYCVQRIEEARITAEVENRGIRDGEVVPACAQACPTKAIRFGDLNSRESEVSRLKNSPRHYAMLEELGTGPRTTYLAPVVNPTEGPE